MTRGLIAALMLAALALTATASDDRSVERHQMVEVIERMRLSMEGGAGQAAFNPEVLAALRTVPRHEFVPRGLSSIA